MGHRLSVLVVCIVVALAAFSAAARAQTARSGDKLNVVTSFSILRDWVANVGGDRVEVSALVGPSGDAHVYAPTPRDAKIVGAAKLIVVNGLGFEGWMDRLVQASATQALVIVASAGVVPQPPPYPPPHAWEGKSIYHPPPVEEGRVGGRLGNPAVGIDPHAWQSVRNAEIYVSNIRDGLIRADQRGRATYETNAAAYIQELARLDADIRHTIPTIPPARQKVITTHDAFGYFAAGMIREQNIPALFFESAVDPRLVRRIAAETGARIGGTLFSDALTAPAGPAPTYLDMMRHNVREIVEALR